MATIEEIKQELNDAKKEHEEAKKNWENIKELLNELEGKLERREWGDDEEMKELWKEQRSRLIKEKESLEADKKRWGGLVEGWGKALMRGGEVPTIYFKTKIADAFPEGLPYIKPKSLVTSSGLKWQYQLDPHLKTILQEETEKHHYHFCNGENDKINRPTYLFFSGAGTGKSRNASEFHKTLIKCLNYSKDLELKKKIQNAWVFNISLENGTGLSRSVEPIGILA
ncbi:17782_t:CDS:2, partial [Gigaspora margarita]